jgi:hypothetical protein
MSRGCSRRSKWQWLCRKESVEVMKRTRARARYPSTALQEMTVLQERAKSLATSLSSSQMYDKSVE